MIGELRPPTVIGDGDGDGDDVVMILPDRRSMMGSMIGTGTLQWRMTRTKVNIVYRISMFAPFRHGQRQRQKIDFRSYFRVERGGDDDAGPRGIGNE